MRKAVVSVVVATALGLAAAAAAPPAIADSDEVTSLTIAATLGSDGRIDVTQTIEVSFAAPNRGLDVPLSVASEFSTDNTQSLTYSDITVTSPTGAPVNAHTVWGSSLGVVQVGDPNSPVNGAQTYVVSYSVDGTVWDPGSHDLSVDLDWTPVAAGWQMLIGQVSVTLTGPSAPKSVGSSASGGSCYLY